MMRAGLDMGEEGEGRSDGNEWRRWIRLFDGCWSEMCMEEVSGTEWRADEERSVVEAEGKGVCYMCEEYDDLWE